jgi:hypothetical protein
MAWLRKDLVYLALSALFLGFFTYSGAVGSKVNRPLPSSPGGSQPVPHPLSPAGEGLLRNLVQAGELSELRWPDFSDYRGHVGKFTRPMTLPC